MGELVDAFDTPIHPQEVRKRLHQVENDFADLETLYYELLQRHGLLEELVLRMAEELRQLRKANTSANQ